MATAICRWMEDYDSGGQLEAILGGVRTATGAKTLDFFICASQTVIELDKKKEAQLIPAIYNALLARGERISIYNSENLQPVPFLPGEAFTKAEYLTRYQLRYGSKATHPNTFTAA